MMRNPIKTIVGRAAFLLALGLALPLVTAPAAYSEPDDHGNESEHGEEGEHHEGVVQLSAEEIREFEIGLAVAGPGTVRQTRTLPAEVRFNEDLVAHIVPRYEGIVTKVLANIGDHVQAGEVLAVIESDGSLAPYEVTTFLAGTVIDKHMTRGEPVTRTEFGFTVVDLSSVWIDITVYQRDIDRIRVGEDVTVRARADGFAVSGKITYVTPVVDEHTRTATARLVVDNTDGHWRPGMFATAEVVTGSFAVSVVVPATAVHTIEGEDVVFVVDDEGFEPRPVEIGRRGKLEMEIRSGLEPGDEYVATGGFTIKAELGKDSFGEGHGH